MAGAAREGASMNCPVCRKETIVLETRGLDRRRGCLVDRGGCGHKFTTTEVLKTEHDRQQKIIKDAQDLAGSILAEG